MSLGRRIFVATFAVLVLLVGAGYWYTHDTASGRILYKRLKAPSPYTFDEIPESLRATDPAALISDLTPASVEALRDELNRVFWGKGQLPGRMPDAVDSGSEPPYLAQYSGLSRMERLVVSFDFSYNAFAYLMYPDNPNGRAVIYHHGYAGTFDKSRDVIEALLGEGFTVAALNYAGYGQNVIGTVDHPSLGLVSLENDRQMYAVKNPLRWYLEPMVVTVNYLAARKFSDISSIGLSAGGWVTTMVAAVDQRVSRTIAVAAGYPIYIRQHNWLKETPLPQLYKPLLDTASYLDTYVLAATGSDRQYIQIFNQYDRCCYRNRFSELYAQAVADTVERTGGGKFEALIDETHADHKISEWAIDVVLEVLAE